MKTIYTFSKKIKDEKINKKEIPDQKDIVKISEIVSKLKTLTGVRVLKFEETGLKTNPQKWIRSILSNEPMRENFDNMENLLHDFTDSMMTRMREDSKYALGLVLENQILLCHSVYGEETITPEWRIIPRMLDADNVLRFVAFSEEKENIEVTFWEKEATNSFMDWLGLTRKQAFLFGGRYRICAEIEKYRIEFQLTEIEMDELITVHPELKHGRINFENQLQYLNIDEIRISRKSYENPEDFLQDYKAEKFGVPKYIEAYKKIKQTSLPLITKYFDEKTQVIRVEGDEKAIEVNKDSGPFDIIFADGEIEFRASYLDELTRKYLNGENLKIFHSGMKFRSEPTVICGMELYNPIRVNELLRCFIDYYHEIKVRDYLLDYLLKFIGIKLIERLKQNSPVDYFFEQLSGNIIKELSIQGKITTTEDQFIEYKSREYFAGKDEVIISRFEDDLRKKLDNSDCKLYLIGVEDDGTIDPFLATRFNSDRIENIRKGIEEKIKSITIIAFSVNDNNNAILIFIASKSS